MQGFRVRLAPTLSSSQNGFLWGSGAGAALNHVRVLASNNNAKFVQSHNVTKTAAVEKGRLNSNSARGAESDTSWTEKVRS
jgi:hypothetical protein